MKLYFSPMACSLASRITIYEKGLDVEFVRVDRSTKRLDDGTDYRRIHALGLVPALETDDGNLVTENAAVLQYLWRRPPGELSEDEQTGLAQWLSFIATELHKATFAPSFQAAAPAEAKAFGLQLAPTRLAYVDRHLQDREHLLDRFTAADAYLYTVLNWTWPTKVGLDDHPNVARYYRAMFRRDSVRRAMEVERPMYESLQAAS